MFCKNRQAISLRPTSLSKPASHICGIPYMTSWAAGYDERPSKEGPNAVGNHRFNHCYQSLQVYLILIERLQKPVRQAFSFGIRHVFIVIQWTVTHGSLNHNESMPYPVWKSCRAGFHNLCIMFYFIILCSFYILHLKLGPNKFKHKKPFLIQVIEQLMGTSDFS